MPKIEYPFVPKSTALMEPGQFWSIPLSNGDFACGRIIQLKLDNGKRDRRMFLSGLMDWVGASPPTEGAIAGRRVLEQGAAHIRSIIMNGGEISGFRDLALDGIDPWYFLESAAPDGRLMHGLDVIGYANREQLTTLEVFSTWGFGVIKRMAEQYFVEKSANRPYAEQGGNRSSRPQGA